MQIKVVIFDKNIIKVIIMHEIDLKNYQIRSDLVVDVLNDLKDMQGIKEEVEEQGEIEVRDFTLDNENVLGKKAGRYITVDFKDVTDSVNAKRVEDMFSKYLKKLLDEKKLLGKSCLVVGLGNQDSTPDSLGPKVARDVLVTRYLFELEKVEVSKGYSSVSSIIPGVSGSTGIESSDIILGIVDRIKPDFLLVIDALASSSIERINRTIQMTDTGIHPGSGVGNKRREISIDTIGIPVIAVGIPTVIDGVTIVSDTIHYMLKQFSYHKEQLKSESIKFAPITSRNYLEHDENLSREEKEKLLGFVGGLTDDEMKSLIFEVLTPIGYNLMVTVKEVDFITEKLSKVLVNGINNTLHESVKGS